MDLRYCCGLHDFQEVKEATAIFQTLTIMTDALKDIHKDFAEKKNF